MLKTRMTALALTCASLVAALLTMGPAPAAHADPELCTQHSYGKVCVQRYPTTHNIRATFYNNRGGSNTLILKIVKQPSEIVASGSYVTVPYGGSTTVNYTYGTTTKLFQAYARFADITAVNSPWT